jgi:arylsulfatase A-like enzyme/Tfp pilus assembly protein PilF
MEPPPLRAGRPAALAVPALVSATVLAAALAGWSCGPASLPRDPAANVLIITLDTTRADRIGAYGYEPIETPHLDRLAAEGVLFENAVSSIPLTLPAHSSLMTGLHPPRHGVRDNGGYFLDDRHTTLAERLGPSGRRTYAAVGAFVLHHLWGLNQGFEVYDDEFAKSGAKSHELLRVQRVGSQVTDRALEWLEQHRDEPFFAWLHFYDPHHPYEPPGEYGERYAAEPYDGEIAYTDHQVGRVLDYLRESGRYDSTLIIVAGDHGEGLGDHHEPDHGIFLYESTVRIPLIVRAPHETYRGTVAGVVRDVDVMPTVLDYLDLEAEPGIQGTSLLGLMAGRPENEPRYAYSETHYCRLHYGWAELASIRDGRYKLIDAPTPELYDLQRDPGERRNIHNGNTEIARPLLQRLDEIREQAANKADASRMDLDPETLDKLMSLGYVGSAAPDTGGELPDPKERLEAMNLLIRAGRESASLLEAQRYDEVAALLEEVLEREPNYMDGYLNLASAYRGQDRTDEAIAVLERALELTPENVNVMQSLGRAHMDRGDDDTAIALFRAINSRSPRYVQAYYGLSEAHLARGDHDSAIAALKRLLEIHPGTPMAEYEIGMVYLRAERFDEAGDWIRRALASAPRLRDAHFNLALIAEARGDLRGAREHYEREVELFPDNGEAGVNLGLLCAQTGDLRCADRAFSSVIRHDPELAVAHYLLARTRVELGSVSEETLALARRAAELDPSLERARRLARQIERALAAGAGGS